VLRVLSYPGVNRYWMMKGIRWVVRVVMLFLDFRYRNRPRSRLWCFNRGSRPCRIYWRVLKVTFTLSLIIIILTWNKYVSPLIIFAKMSFRIFLSTISSIKQTNIHYQHLLLQIYHQYFATRLFAQLSLIILQIIHNLYNPLWRRTSIASSYKSMVVWPRHPRVNSRSPAQT